MMKHSYPLLLIALCAAILSVATAPAFADEFRERGTAFIDRKGPNALMFDGHGFKRFADRYMGVTSQTSFYDENGVPISLLDLKIPCQATIEYRKKLSSAVPEAISVTVEHYPGDRPVDTKWNLPVMKPERPQ